MHSYAFVPQPQSVKFTQRRFAVTGFSDLSPAVAEAVGVGKGRWRFEAADKAVESEPTGAAGGTTGNAPQETSITISDGVVRYTGRLHDAAATVAQLLCQTPGELPEGTITDRPLFAVRGFHQDIGRGGVPTVDTWKRMLRWLFLCKYTHLGIYFEDLFPWEKYPDIGAHRGRMSREELSTVVDYGAQLGIEVFPSMNFAGHMENILAVQPFWKFSDWHWLREGVLDLSNPEACDFACELLQEVIDFFPSQLIHIGGDEPWALGRGKGLDHDGIYRGPEFYRDHHARLIEMVKSAGKTPVLWGDMISGSIMMGEMVSDEAKKRWATIFDDPVWRDTVIANWKYNPKDDAEWFSNEIDAFRSRGMDQLACTGLRNSMTFYPRLDWALHNNQEFLEAARRERLPGFLVTSWGGTGSECLFSFLDPLILGCAQYGATRDANWKQAWCALTGETTELAEIRESFGTDVNNMTLREALYRHNAFTTLDARARNDFANGLKTALAKAEGVELPEDVEFLRNLVETGVSIAEERVTAEELLGLAATYARLWKAERKPEGLDVTITRMWGAAGCYDLGLNRDSLGWFSRI